MNLVSIIVPVYNSEKYITRCIDSIINQTYKDIELIIVDDGSTDNSIDRINEYASKDSRIKLFTQKNSGPSVARNYGLDVATGDYIMFVDADDYIDKSMIEQMIRLVSNKNSIVFSNNIEIYKDKTEERKLFFNNGKENINKNRVIEEISSGKAGLVCAKLFNKDTVDKYNIRFESDITMCEDQIFFLNVARYCDEFIHLSKSLYYYDRCNENSITMKYNPNAMDNQMNVLKHIQSILIQSELEEDKIYEIINNRLIGSINYCISNEILEGNLLKSKYKIKNIEKIINNPEFQSKLLRITPKSFREKVLINSWKNSNYKKIYYTFYILDRIINPMRFKFKKILKR